MSGIIKRFQAWNQVKFRSFRGWINLEKAVSYRFPVPEGIVSIFLFFALSSILSISLMIVCSKYAGSEEARRREYQAVVASIRFVRDELAVGKEN